MVAHRPWYQAYPADFFAATQGWDVDMKGPYRLFIDLLNERDRPVPDEPKFIAGILGCSVQRWKKVRAFLIEEGKITLTPDAMHLTNPRFEREHAKRHLDSLAAQDFGHAGGKASAARRAGQQELGFDPDAPYTPAPARTEPRKNGDKIATSSVKSSKKLPSHSGLPEENTNDFNGSAQDPPQAPCARVRDQIPESKSLLSSHLSDSEPREPGRLANADLKTLYDEVCEVAGFCPVQPAAIDRAMTQVEKWRESDIDFETVVLPSIRAVVLSSPDPTRTLGRFNARVLHEHARFKAAEKKQGTYVPPEIPKLNPDGEDPTFLALRTELLERCGDRAYCLAFNNVRFVDAGPCHGDRRPLQVKGADYATTIIRDGRWRSILLAAAAPHGFTDIW